MATLLLSDDPLYEELYDVRLEAIALRNYVEHDQTEAIAALRAKALGFKVCFFDPYLPNGVDKAVGISRVRSLEELFAVVGEEHARQPAGKLGVFRQRRAWPGAVVG